MRNIGTIIATAPIYISAIMKAFPKSFLWGAATSSFQIEGATHADGRGSSIWDDFCRTPGKVSDGSNGDIACDHYHRYPEDIALMKSLGLQAYRFSIAWPRILPQGTGKVNPAGLDFYERLVDGLLAAGIEAFPTLYHWDLPSALQDKGGWTHPDSPQWFTEYTQAVVKRLGDRAQNWTTLNEPHVFTWLGYGLGFHAPGHTDRTAYCQTVRNALLAHGRASQVLRAHNSALRVGIANSLLRIEPAAPGEEAAADAMDQITNRIWMDPIIHGEVPAWARGFLQNSGTEISSSDLSIIHQKPDFVGVNYYNRLLASSTGIPERPYTLQHPDYPGVVKTDIGWEVYPQGLQYTLEMLRDRYGNIPAYITENGACYNDEPSSDGQIHDTRRTDYYRQHLDAMEKSIVAGCDVRGYFAWSLMDNFEWAHGYSKRFGLVHVDYARDNLRTPKDSALWYQNKIAEFKSLS